MKRNLLILTALFGLVFRAAGQNTPPFLEPPKSITVAEFTNGCISIVSKDDDGDQTTITVQSPVVGYTFTNNNGSVTNASGEICWTPTTADTAGSPHPFYITVSDGSLSVEDTFWIKVVAAPRMKKHYKRLDSCGTLTIDHEGDQWTTDGDIVIRDENNNAIFSKNSLSAQVQLNPGTYRVFTTLSNEVPLTTLYIDSVIVEHGIDIRGIEQSFDSSAMEFVLRADNRSLDPITYQWIREDAPNQYSAIGNGDSVLRIQLWENAKVGLIAFNPFGCVDTTLTQIQVDPNSIRELKNSLTLYPNPASEKIHIRSDNYKVKHYIIQSADGKIMLRGKLHPDAETIKIDGLKSGVYFVTVILDNGELVRKPIVVRE